MKNGKVTLLRLVEKRKKRKKRRRRRRRRRRKYVNIDVDS